MKVLPPIILEPEVPVASATKSYHLELNLSNNDISLKEIDLADTPAPKCETQRVSGWRCDVIDQNKVVLNSFLFDVPTNVCSDIAQNDSGLSGGCIAKDKSSFSLQVPYYENGAGIVLSRPDGKSYSFNTIGFARLCGDNICESSENYSTCATDCRSGVSDGVCDGAADGTCDPDCFAAGQAGTDSDCRAASYSPGIEIAWWIAGGLALVLIIGIFVTRKRKFIKKTNSRKTK